jgi:hypothetical protein
MSELGTCELCSEPLTAQDDIHPVMPGAAHRECLLRCVLGGIGHLENHAYWCLEKHDPDGGRTYRQSALEVDEWVMNHERDAKPWQH